MAAVSEVRCEQLPSVLSTGLIHGRSPLLGGTLAGGGLLVGFLWSSHLTQRLDQRGSKGLGEDGRQSFGKGRSQNRNQDSFFIWGCLRDTFSQLLHRCCSQSLCRVLFRLRGGFRIPAASHQFPYEGLVCPILRCGFFRIGRHEVIPFIFLSSGLCSYVQSQQGALERTLQASEVQASQTWRASHVSRSATARHSLPGETNPGKARTTKEAEPQTLLLNVLLRVLTTEHRGPDERLDLLFDLLMALHHEQDGRNASHSFLCAAPLHQGGQEQRELGTFLFATALHQGSEQKRELDTFLAAALHQGSEQKRELDTFLAATLAEQGGQEQRVLDALRSASLLLLVFTCSPANFITVRRCHSLLLIVLFRKQKINGRKLLELQDVQASHPARRWERHSLGLSFAQNRYDPRHTHPFSAALHNSLLLHTAQGVRGT